MTDWRRGWPLLALRLAVGSGFMAHGVAKWSRGPEAFGRLLHQVGVPMPSVTAWLVTLLETFGGAAIVLGILVRLTSLPLIASMIVAIVTVQGRYGFSSVNTVGLTQAGPVFGPPGYEINLLYIASLAVLAIVGPGPLAVDSWLATRRRDPPARSHD